MMLPLLGASWTFLFQLLPCHGSGISPGSLSPMNAAIAAFRLASVWLVSSTLSPWLSSILSVLGCVGFLIWRNHCRGDSRRIGCRVQPCVRSGPQRGGRSPYACTRPLSRRLRESGAFLGTRLRNWRPLTKFRRAGSVGAARLLAPAPRAFRRLKRGLRH